MPSPVWKLAVWSSIMYIYDATHTICHPRALRLFACVCFFVPVGFSHSLLCHNDSIWRITTSLSRLLSLCRAHFRSSLIISDTYVRSKWYSKTAQTMPASTYMITNMQEKITIREWHIGDYAEELLRCIGANIVCQLGVGWAAHILRILSVISRACIHHCTIHIFITLCGITEVVLHRPSCYLLRYSLCSSPLRSVFSLKFLRLNHRYKKFRISMKVEWIRPIAA